MGVIESQEGAVLVVIDQRRVQGAAAKDAGADEVPEGGPDYVGVGQPVIERLLPANELVLLDCLDDQQHQR
jgi:hypothetical protein